MSDSEMPTCEACDRKIQVPSDHGVMCPLKGQFDNTPQNRDYPGYPNQILTELENSARGKYRSNIEEHGPGKNWLEPDAPEARWHIWKACDEMFQARDHAHQNRYNEAMDNAAHALNHMLMALEIAKVEKFRDDP